MTREISRRRLLLATVLVGCALLVAAPRSAEAQAAAVAPRLEVLVLLGTTCVEKKVDPEIGEPPPIRYGCWKIAGKKILPLVQGSPSTMVLPNKRTFQVAYNGATAEPSPRFKMSTSISKPDATGFVPLADITAEPGKKFHVGGFAHEGGSLVLAIRILSP